MHWTTKFLLLSFFNSLIAGSSLAEVNLDSLRGIWLDASLDDSIRLSAGSQLAWNGYLYTDPDSAFAIAEEVYELATGLGSVKRQATSLNIMATAKFFQGNLDVALIRYQECLVLRKKLGDSIGEAEALNNVGAVFWRQGNYQRTLEAFKQSLAIKGKIGDAKGVATTRTNIGTLFQEQGELDKALEFFELGIKDEPQGSETRAAGLNNIAAVYHEKGKAKRASGDSLQANQLFQLALRTFNASLQIEKTNKSDRGLARSWNNIGEVYQELGDHQLAIEHYFKSLELREAMQDNQGISTSLTNIATLYNLIGNHVGAIEMGAKALAISQETGFLRNVRAAAKALFTGYEATGNDRKALEMYKLYRTTNDSIINTDKQRAIIRQEYQFNYEKQLLADSLEFSKKEVLKDLQIKEQKDRLTTQRIALGGSAIGLALIIGLSIIVIRNKRKSEDLLLNILPFNTAEELKKTGSAEARRYENVSVMFVDIAGFTEIAEQLPPRELVGKIHDCFSLFDQICVDHGIEKIKTIGDAYMAACGVPEPKADHAKRLLTAALEIKESMKNDEFRIRIGIHSGPVVAGIVGTRKFQYDIWGDTVNTASRMESSGDVGRVNISDSTYKLVKDDFCCEFRGEIEAKGKGKVKMYFVEGPQD